MFEQNKKKEISNALLLFTLMINMRLGNSFNCLYFSCISCSCDYFCDGDGIKYNVPRINKWVYNNKRKFDASKDPEEECVICLNSMKEGKNNTVVPLPCHKSHVFHYECLLNWVKNQQICPVCRAQIILSTPLYPQMDQI